MQPYEVFKMIRDVEYTTSGIDVDWTVKVDEVEKTVWLIFEESDGKQDWKTNLNFPAKLYKKQKHFFLLHRGYGKAWKSCNDEVMKAFITEVMKNPDYEIKVTGWSYGGAMALIAAEDFYFRTNIKVNELITFGAPRPLFGIITRHYFRKCAETFNQYSFSYDFVTWLPFFYSRANTRLMDKKNSWKLWRTFQTPKYHCSYGEKEYYC